MPRHRTHGGAMRGPERLTRTRALIAAVAGGRLLLLAAPRRLPRAAAHSKHSARRPLGDPAREREVHRRAARLAAQLDVPATTARELMALAIADARRCQGLAPDVD